VPAPARSFSRETNERGPGWQKPQRGKSAKRPTAKSHARRKSSAKRGGRRWSKRVTETSDALDLKGGVFKLRDPKKSAASLKRSAERSHRRKANPYRSALSMLTFYINRAGKNLSASRRRVLDRAKDELKEQFHRA
jgi:hypothetical protein